tara:strand:- start:304 stop:543 length:240 start_codon:yes stop_codon:yes gene_type:complete
MGARAARYKNTISRRNQGGGPSKSGLVSRVSFGFGVTNRHVRRRGLGNSYTTKNLISRTNQTTGRIGGMRLRYRTYRRR